MRNFRPILLAGMLWALAWLGGSAHADVATQLVSVTATVASAANLTLGASTLTFNSANPATTPSIAAVENGTTISVNARTGSVGAVLLTVLAGGDLTSGGNTIPISAITWTATGSGFQGGTMSKLLAQTVASWVGPGTHSGTVSFYLANSFSYVIGTYTANVTYTLVAP